VADLKDFSRLDRGAVAQVDLHQGLESTLRIAQHQIGKRAVRKPSARSRASPARLRRSTRCCLNLIVNAAQATPEAGGQIGIRTSLHDAGHVAIDVADNGHGIPPEALRASSTLLLHQGGGPRAPASASPSATRSSRTMAARLRSSPNPAIPASR